LREMSDLMTGRTPTHGCGLMLRIEKSTLVTGGAGFLTRTFATDCWLEANRFCASTTSQLAPNATSAILLDRNDFELLRQDVTFHLCVEVDAIYNLACPASPHSLSAGPGADDQNDGSWRDQPPRLGQAAKMQNLPGVNERNLR
jgi:hypothetical protein